MNKNNIGEFISKLRKEKGLTQQELAKLLNVTDRAISNYETGRRIPDISLYKPICDVFDITVSELINGERINEDKLLISSNNTIINTLKKNKKDKNRLSLIIKILFLILIALVYILINYYKDLYPKIDIYNFSLTKIINFAFISLYLVAIFLIAGIDKEQKQIEKSVLYYALGILERFISKNRYI